MSAGTIRNAVSSNWAWIMNSQVTSQALSGARYFGNGVCFRLGRLYETFWFSQSNLKWTLVLLYPGLLFYVRWRAEHQYKYRVYIADDELVPHNEITIPVLKKKLFKFKNGDPFYMPGAASADEFLAKIYNKKVPAGTRIGCAGRMFEGTDNLALAVHNFCHRHPLVTIWKEGQGPSAATTSAQKVSQSASSSAPSHSSAHH